MRNYVDPYVTIPNQLPWVIPDGNYTNDAVSTKASPVELSDHNRTEQSDTANYDRTEQSDITNAADIQRIVQEQFVQFLSTHMDPPESSVDAEPPSYRYTQED